MTTPLPMGHNLSPAALNGESILRVLARPNAPTAAVAIAVAADRPKKNIGRELDQLRQADLIDAANALTAAGRAALAALDRAADLIEAGHALIYVSPAQLDDNPLNPRKAYDAQQLEAFADTVESAGRILQPLEVSPPQPNGRRWIWIGHRRKRGALIVEARYAARGADLPPGLAQGVPCIEREATPAESLFIAVVENRQRENLTPWEEARAYAALAAQTGWSARELARRTGAAPNLDQGDETGVRDVQEKIKVARDAPADLVEAHEQGLLTWEQFRGALRNGRVPTPEGEPKGLAPDRPDDQTTGQSVGVRIDAPAVIDLDTPAPLFEDPAPAPLTLRQWVVLTELAAHISTSPETVTIGDGEGTLSYVPVGKYWLDLDAVALQKDGLISFKHQGRPHAFITAAGRACLGDRCDDPRVILWVEKPRVEWAAAGFDPEDRDPSALWPFWISWLTPEPVADAAPAPAAEPPQAEEPHPDDVDATAVLQDAADMLAQWPPADPIQFRARFLELVERTKVSVARAGLAASVTDAGVVVDSDGAAFCVADQDGAHPDDIARARALLIAVAVNLACGHYSLEGE